MGFAKPIEQIFIKLSRYIYVSKRYYTRKIWDDIYKMVLISSISFSAVLGNMVREYLSLNLIFLIFLINMGAIFLRMYLSKKKNKPGLFTA